METSYYAEFILLLVLNFGTRRCPCVAGLSSGGSSMAPVGSSGMLDDVPFDIGWRRMD